MAQNAGQEYQEKSLQQRKKEFEEVMEHARQLPSEADIMKMALAIAANTTEDEITRVRALQLIQEYVEDIDLANGAVLLVFACPHSRVLSKGFLAKLNIATHARFPTMRMNMIAMCLRSAYTLE